MRRLTPPQSPFLSLSLSRVANSAVEGDNMPAGLRKKAPGSARTVEADRVHRLRGVREVWFADRAG
jgi:hypothetical protein